METKRSPVNDALFQFIRTEMEKEFSFILKGKSIEEANQFVKAMRVQLSRLRNYVKSRGKTPAPFKMLTIRIEVAQDSENKILGARIILKKSGSGQVRAMEAVDQLFAHLTVGGNAENG